MIKDILNDPKLGLPETFKYGSNANVATLLTDLLQIVVLLGTFLAFIWFVWGAFQYIFAGGDKEKLGKARSRMTWAIVGLVILLLAFLLTQFAGQILQPKPGQVPLPGFSLVETVHAAPVDIGKDFGLATEKTGNLGDALGLLVNPAFAIATTAVVFYFLFGAFKWLTSAGNKDAISSARGMITHAIIGFVILMFAFLIFQFVLARLFGITGLQLIR